MHVEISETWSLEASCSARWVGNSFVHKSLSRYHFWFDKVHIKRSHRLQEGRYCIMTCPFHFSHCRHLITNYYHVFFSQNQSAITVSLRCPVKSAGISSLMLFVVLVLQLKASQEEVILKICNMLVIEAIDSAVRRGSRWWIQPLKEEKAPHICLESSEPVVFLRVKNLYSPCDC